jgi:putative peptide zinc metalloprotease protein
VPVDRPTFSESWYRVAALRPRLRATVQIHRQHFRGRIWHVAQDPSSNQFFRLNPPAYRFVGLLDGTRTVADAWRLCNEQLGDEAPTQGEAIQLLGQLYVSNLLQADLPPDTEGLFNRYRRRVHREVRGYLSNFLFVRIPLIDPDRFLNRWVGVFGRVFSWYGLAAWVALVAAGLYVVAGRTDALRRQAGGVFDLDNLLLLYLAMALIKVVHEFGHGFACKRFGRLSGTGGEVHVMGIMFLVFTPLPYVDASSAWAFRNKWHRVVVGSAGILIELAVASVAAIVWAHSAGTVEKIAYNMMFIASVSTILFNGNPLLRYDGYYILSDLVGIPNLWNRSREYVHYLVKRYVWGVRRARNPAHTPGERAWFVGYGLASMVYRIFICIRILIFIAGKFFFLGAALAVAAVAAWVMVPLGKFLHYLFSSPELTRVRSRAVATTAAVVAAVVVGLGVLAVPDRRRMDGVNEPAYARFVHAGADGFVTAVLPTQSAVPPNGAPPLVRMRNPDLDEELARRRARRRQLSVYKNAALLEEVYAAHQQFERELEAFTARIARFRRRIAALTIRPEQPERPDQHRQWIAHQAHRLPGTYLRRGDKIGLVASPGEVLIRAVATQDLAGMLKDEIEVKGNADARRVEIRVRGRPDLSCTGRIIEIMRAGTRALPSDALGYTAGGPIETAPDDPRRAKQPFFIVRIRPDGGSQVPLLSGQRVVVRLSLPPKPLAVQWWHGLRRLLPATLRRDLGI